MSTRKTEWVFYWCVSGMQLFHYMIAIYIVYFLSWSFPVVLPHCTNKIITQKYHHLTSSDFTGKLKLWFKHIYLCKSWSPKPCWLVLSKNIFAEYVLNESIKVMMLNFRHWSTFADPTIEMHYHVWYASTRDAKIFLNFIKILSMWYKNGYLVWSK